MIARADQHHPPGVSCHGRDMGAFACHGYHDQAKHRFHMLFHFRATEYELGVVPHSNTMTVWGSLWWRHFKYNMLPLCLFHPSCAQASAFFSPFDSPLVASGIGTGPPGESGSLAVSTSTPSSVTSRVCSALRQYKQLEIHTLKLTKLRSQRAVLRDTCPVVRPCLVSV